eukprot:358950_1
MATQVHNKHILISINTYMLSNTVHVSKKTRVSLYCFVLAINSGNINHVTSIRLTFNSSAYLYQHAHVAHIAQALRIMTDPSLSTFHSNDDTLKYSYWRDIVLGFGQFDERNPSKMTLKTDVSGGHSDYLG